MPPGLPFLPRPPALFGSAALVDASASMNSPSSAPNASSSSPVPAGIESEAVAAETPFAGPAAAASSSEEAGNNARDDLRTLRVLSSSSSEGFEDFTRAGLGAGDPNAASGARVSSPEPPSKNVFEDLARAAAGAGLIDTNAWPAISRTSKSGECTSFFFCGCPRGVRLPTARCAPGGGVDSRLSRLVIPSSGSLLYWSFMDAENATAVTAPAGRDRIVRFRLKSASHIPEVRPVRRDAISDHAEEGGTAENRTPSSLSRFARFARNASKNAAHSASDHRGPSAEKFPAELVIDAGLGFFNFCAAAGGAVGDDSGARGRVRREA